MPQAPVFKLPSEHQNFIDFSEHLENSKTFTDYNVWFDYREHLVNFGNLWR
jgi:hypothetical protein